MPWDVDTSLTIIVICAMLHTLLVLLGAVRGWRG